MLDRAHPPADAPAVRNAAGRRSRKGKLPSGLGRGLAGILETDTKPTAKTNDTSGALSLLLGADAPVTTTDVDIINKIHKFVIDAAVTAMVDGFNAEGAVVASRSVAQSADPSEPLPNLSLRVPPSCSVSSPLMFALYGQLSNLLNSDPSELSAGIEQRQIGDTWIWLYRVHEEGTGGEAEHSQATVAATFRSTPFEQWETDALSSLVASVAFTLGTSRKQAKFRRELQAGTTVTVTHGSGTTAGQVHAQVRHDGPLGATETGPDGFISANAWAADPVMAVATAAASIGQSERNVVFAGSSEVAGRTVTVVMLTEAGTRPRLGVAVHQPGELKGVAEAVITAGI